MNPRAKGHDKDDGDGRPYNGPKKGIERGIGFCGAVRTTPWGETTVHEFWPLVTL
jgi:hypothetical protein